MQREIAEDIFLDEESETVALCIDRVSLMLDMKEFFDLAKRLDTALKELAAATASMEEAEEEVAEEASAEAEESEAEEAAETPDAE